MPPAEPTLAALPNPLARYWYATRPAFLTITLVGCLLGLASAAAGGVHLAPAEALATIVFALAAHAGVNVINDYHDARNGSDALNQERIFPFTGGSRYVQNRVMTLQAVGVFGHALLAAVVPAGLWLAAGAGAGLIWIGMAGLLLGWAYSAPPLKLMCRGLGEIAVACGWLLVVAGADFVQRHAFSAAPLAAGACYALLVANLLYANEFPDALADAAAGKRTLVVRLGRRRAWRGYAAIAAAAYGALALACAAGALPVAALLGLATLPLSWQAGRILRAHGREPARLAPALKLGILAAHLNGLLVAAALAGAAWLA